MSSIEPDDAGDQVDSGEEITRGLIIACRDRAKLLEFGEEVLDQVLRRVEVSVELAGLLAIGLRGDDRGFSVSVWPATQLAWHDACSAAAQAASR